MQGRLRVYITERDSVRTEQHFYAVPIFVHCQRLQSTLSANVHTSLPAGQFTCCLIRRRRRGRSASDLY